MSAPERGGVAQAVPAAGSPTGKPPGSPALDGSRRLRRFVFVGASAALVHLLSAALCVRLGLHPLAANVVAFHIAFVVSYIGQSRLTFADRDVSVRDGLPRFLAVSYLGFATNETMYALLLAYTRLHYLVALAGVLVAVAAMTFLLSRAWAFRERGPHRSE